MCVRLVHCNFEKNYERSQRFIHEHKSNREQKGKMEIKMVRTNFKAMPEAHTKEKQNVWIFPYNFFIKLPIGITDRKLRFHDIKCLSHKSF